MKQRGARYIIGWLLLSLILLVYPIKYLSFLVLPEWSWCFASGIAFYFVYKEGASLQSMITILLSIALAGWTTYIKAAHMSQGYDTHFSIVVVWSMILLYFLFFSLVAFHKTRWLSNRRFLWLGMLTYPLFLLHQDVGYMVFNTLHANLNKYLLLLVLVIGMMVISMGISYIADSISRILRKRLNQASLRLSR